MLRQRPPGGNRWHVYVLPFWILTAWAGCREGIAHEVERAAFLASRDDLEGAEAVLAPALARWQADESSHATPAAQWQALTGQRLFVDLCRLRGDAPDATVEAWRRMVASLPVGVVHNAARAELACALAHQDPASVEAAALAATVLAAPFPLAPAQWAQLGGLQIAYLVLAGDLAGALKAAEHLAAGTQDAIVQEAANDGIVAVAEAWHRRGDIRRAVALYESLATNTLCPSLAAEAHAAAACGHQHLDDDHRAVAAFTAALAYHPEPETIRGRLERSEQRLAHVEPKGSIDGAPRPSAGRGALARAPRAPGSGARAR